MPDALALTRLVVPAWISLTNTSVSPLESLATRLLASLEKATTRPSAHITASSELPLALSVSAALTLSSVVAPVCDAVDRTGPWDGGAGRPESATPVPSSTDEAGSSTVDRPSADTRAVHKAISSSRPQRTAMTARRNLPRNTDVGNRLLITGLPCRVRGRWWDPRSSPGADLGCSERAASGCWSGLVHRPWCATCAERRREPKTNCRAHRQHPAFVSCLC